MSKQGDYKPSLAVKVTSLFKPHKDTTPMFNRPLPKACPHHRLSRVLHSIFLTALILIAVPVIALKAMTYSFIEDNRDTGFAYQTVERDGEPGVSLVMAALPRNLHHAPAKLALVAAVISIFLGVVHLCFVVFDWNSGKRTQSWAFRRNIMFLHIINSILVLFALVSIAVTHNNTSHFRDEFVNFRASRLDDFDKNSSTDNFFSYNIGTFDLETWSCELKDVSGVGMVREDYLSQCMIEVAGRNIMIPFVIIAWLVAFIGIWGLVGGGRRGPDGERVKTQDVGLDLSKMNAV